MMAHPPVGSASGGTASKLTTSPGTVLIPRRQTDRRCCVDDQVLAYAVATRSRVLYVDNGHPSTAPATQISDVEYQMTLTQPGLATALSAGYTHIAAAEYPRCWVVRMDCLEHPAVVFPKLLAVLEHVDLGVGVPDFGLAQLGNTDERMFHTRIVPALFAQISPSLSCLAGAHGYQAWRGSALFDSLGLAREFVRVAEKGRPDSLRWGFDAAMIIASSLLGHTMEIYPFQPASSRGRDRAKIRDQASCIAAIVDAAWASSGSYRRGHPGDPPRTA